MLRRELQQAYRAHLAAGALQAHQPRSTRELVQQVLQRMDRPRQFLGYTCMPPPSQLVDAQELEELQGRSLDILGAAAAAADGGTAEDQLLGE